MGIVYTCSVAPEDMITDEEADDQLAWVSSHPLSHEDTLRIIDFMDWTFLASDEWAGPAHDGHVLDHLRQRFCGLFKNVDLRSARLTEAAFPIDRFTCAKPGLTPLPRPFRTLGRDLCLRLPLQSAVPIGDELFVSLVSDAKFWDWVERTPDDAKLTEDLPLSNRELMSMGYAWTGIREEPTNEARARAGLAPLAENNR
jgi:hypothetical protein